MPETPALSNDRAVRPRRWGLARRARWVAAAWVATLLAGQAQARECRVVVYDHGDFEGPRATFVDDQATLPPAIDATISSIRVVAGEWVFYDAPRFAGRTITYRPGSFPRIPLVWNDKIRSMQCHEIGPAVSLRGGGRKAS